jgi:anaerobic magnesium-protoporphyrin IX monomethyl ester cyclase
MDLTIDHSRHNYESMRWLLIGPGNLAGDFSNVPCGIAILAAILEQNGIFVRVKDYSVEPLDHDALRQFIHDNRISHVGITMMTCQAEVGYDLAKFIKKLDQNMVVVSGGIHPTIMPDESLQNDIDIVYRDEAEVSFTRSLPYILRKPLDYRELRNIKGITFLVNGESVSTPDADRITDLDSVPLPAYHLFRFPEAYPTQFLYTKGYSSNLITSRGCTGHCVFCSKHYQGVYYQSPEKVVEQFIFLRDKYHIAQIFVQDDFFSYDLNRVERICDLLIENNVNVPWVCSNTRADSVTYELFKKMKDSGCISVAFGVESGNESVRKKLGKNLRTEDIFNAVRSAKRAGLLTSAFYIFGNHCETWENALDTIEFAKKLNTDAVNFSINCPFPGSPLYTMLKKKGINLTKEWGKYRTWGKPLFTPDFLTMEQIVKLQKKAYREFYLRPSYLAKQFANLLKMKNFLMYRRGLSFLLEQYFDYKIIAKNSPIAKPETGDHETGK